MAADDMNEIDKLKKLRDDGKAVVKLVGVIGAAVILASLNNKNNKSKKENEQQKNKEYLESERDILVSKPLGKTRYKKQIDKYNQEISNIINQGKEKK